MIEVKLIRKTIFDPRQGGACNCTDAIITYLGKTLTSRQPGWNVSEEYFKIDVTNNHLNNKRFLP